VIGGTGPDIGHCVQQTADGGYILVGDSDSNKGGDVGVGRHGDTDIWAVKVNATGGLVWEKMIGGSSTDRVGSVQQTLDGGYILLGSTGSTNYDATGPAYGGVDLWVIKIGPTGAITWQKHLGGNLDDAGTSVRQTADGGYILLGESKSSANGIVTEANHGPVNSLDAWAVKLSSAGAVEWNRLIGGSGDEHGRSVRQAADGGYVLLADSASSLSGDVTGTTHGGADYWVVALDAAGAIRWQRLYGGGANDYAASVQQTADGGYVLAGYSGSGVGGDVTRATHGSSDYWLVKLNPALSPAIAVPPSTLAPTDTDADGLHDDVNGNGRRDFADVVLYFNRMAWIAANEPVALFDYNRNGRIDFADVVWLFNHL
jgi:PKD repeat protein